MKIKIKSAFFIQLFDDISKKDKVDTINNREENVSIKNKKILMPKNKQQMHSALKYSCE